MTGAPKTIHECAAANMSAAEAASAMGVSLGAAYQRAHRAGVALRDTRAERMRKLHADPEFAAAHAERMRKRNADPEFAAANAERMRKLHADPEFAAAHAERMRKLHADPEFAAANAERMRKLHADPEFAAANAERMRKRNADPEYNPLVTLTARERADYDVLKANGYSRSAAFFIIGRADLITQGAAE